MRSSHPDYDFETVTMAPASRGTPGLLLRGGVWHIDKVIYGRRICESTGTRDLTEAEALLARRVTQARRVHLFGEQREHTFREAAAKFLAENQHKRSLERDERALASLDPFIGALPLQRVHHSTLAPYIRFRLDKGRSPGTINRDLAVVRRILNLAARLWHDETDRPWLPVAPLIQMQRHPHARVPYPLSVVEQRLLFSELEGHLASMALFKVNTGLREQEVVNLRWQWESNIPELGASIFVIPRDYVKNALDRYVVLNRIARSVIASCRGRHPEFVFTYEGNPVTRIYNSGWKAARRRAAARYERELGRPCPAGFRSIRVHDLKHSFGHRLRVADVSFEDRKLLLGHKAQHVTTHYSAPEIGALIEASEKICELESRASPAISVVRSRA
jgi:integrase